jgi:adenylate cyclase
MPEIQFRPDGARIEVEPGTRLIDAIRRARLPIASPCGDDLICGKCGVRIVSGEVSREAEVERDAKARNRVPAALRLACAIRVRGDLVVSADYWGSARR